MVPGSEGGPYETTRRCVGAFFFGDSERLERHINFLQVFIGKALARKEIEESARRLLETCCEM